MFNQPAQPFLAHNRAGGSGGALATSVGLLFMGGGLRVIVPVLAATGIARTQIGAKGGAHKIREQIVSGVTAAVRSKHKDSEAELQAQIGAASEKILQAVKATPWPVVDGLTLEVK